MSSTQLQQLVERLLYEEESETLDFKEQQYPFVKATNEEKAEILKDILAFANAWRRSDAYILVGVKEIKGGKSAVVGVSEHLEDASLQEFVNFKTQHPVHFSYQACICEDKPVGVFCIPVQDRPVFLKCDFGGLRKNVVYVRRGTSTAEANPDEIAKMREFDSGVSKPSPELELFFLDKETGKCSGREISVCSRIVHFPERDKIPDYGSKGLFGYTAFGDNKNYYRELAVYWHTVSSVASIGFAVKNTGNALASNVRLEIQINDNCEAYSFLDSLPSEPSHTTMLPAIKPLRKVLSQEPERIKRYAHSWFICIHFGNVQSGQTVTDEDSFYFGALRDCVLKFDGIIFSDQTPEPIRFPMTVAVEAIERDIDLETFLKAVRAE